MSDLDEKRKSKYDSKGCVDRKGVEKWLMVIAQVRNYTDTVL